MWHLTINKCSSPDPLQLLLWTFQDDGTRILVGPIGLFWKTESSWFSVIRSCGHRTNIERMVTNEISLYQIYTIHFMVWDLNANLSSFWVFFLFLSWFILFGEIGPHESVLFHVGAYICFIKPAIWLYHWTFLYWNWQKFHTSKVL